MSRAVSLVSLTLLAALAPVSAAVAQMASPAAVPALSATPAAPGAGEMLRDLPPQPGAMPALPDATSPQAPAPVPGAQAPAVRFVLRSFEAHGATALTPQQINTLTEPYIGQPMADKELAALVAALRRRYEDMGVTLVSVGFPTQDVSAGSLRLDVVEPRLGRVAVPTGAGSPLSEARVQGLLAFFCLKSGGLLNTQSLERVMFALNDMPGVQAKASLSPAGDEGVYNLSIQTQPRRWWDASVGLDNQGLGDVGRWRTTAMLRLNNPLGMGDNLDVQTMLSTMGGVKVGRVAYELPVGYTPARISLAYAKVAYALGGQFQAYGAEGTARVLESNLSYPLMRSRNRTLMARLGAESKQLSDELNAFDTQTDKRILGAVAALTYESRDSFLGGGFNGASAQLHWGHLKFKQIGLADAGVAGRFGKAELQYSRLQGLSRTVSLYASVSQQLASRNLDSAEKMALGGPRGVRAYPVAEGASDEASLLNSELRLWLNSNWTAFALYDWARGRRVRSVAPASEADNDVQLHGAGLGLVASYPNWATVKATVAWRGKRPAETDSGHDSPRLFVQAQHTF
jgi:hemolysin activation/secretion protein